MKTKSIAMKTSLIFILIVLLGLTSCQKTENVLPEIPNLPEKSAKLISSDNAFGLDLFSRAASLAEKNKNTTVSPLSVSLALAMTYNGARGETKTEMEKAMNLAGLTPDQINNSHKALVVALQSSDSKVILEIANAIYSHQGFTVLPDFTSTNRNFYQAEVNALNFANTAEALKTINGWVAQKTHDKIPTIIDTIDPALRMILLNAIYFNGIWKNKFGEKDTHNYPFYLADGTTKDVPTMKLETSLEYASNNLFSAVNLPYGNGQFQMTVLLPNEGKTTKNVIAELNSDNWQKWEKSFEAAKPVVVTMPRFKFSWELRLNDILQSMGMKQAFMGEVADFSGISGAKDLYIGYVIHKTYIDVNENGTEAAAVTAVGMFTNSIGEPDLRKYFTVNRPFLFAITEKTTGAILFIGEVTNPEYQM
jgi:serine protease inhibitor